LEHFYELFQQQWKPNKLYSKVLMKSCNVRCEWK
jgi:hypothetical protein